MRSISKLTFAVLVAALTLFAAQTVLAQDLCDADPDTTLVFVDSDITLDTVWTADNTYVLGGVIYVTNNATLTIEAGTVIRGRPDSNTPGTNNPGALVMTRGSKIYALGSPYKPILMTSCGDDNYPGRTPDINSLYTNKFDALEFTAQYGGLILLGRGMVARNTADGPDPANENQIEGLTAEEEKGFYGGCSEVYDPIADPSVCDDDDSGVVRYFTVAYGGFNLAEANEINGITLGGVGRSTDMHHLEVFQNKDDGFEMFGGAVNLKNVIVSNVGDDSFDYDEGWRGKVQYAFSMQGLSGVGVADDQGDHGGEHDGGTGQDDSEPFAIPTFFNTTYIGTGQKNHAKKDGNGVLLIRDNAGGRYYNSAFLDFGGASIMIEGGASETGRSSERAQTDYDNLDPDGDGTDNPGFYLLPTDVNNDGVVDKQLELIDNTFWCIGRQEDPDIVAMGRVGTIPSDGACRLDADPTTGSDTSCAEDADCTTAGESCYDPTERWDNKATKDHFDNGLFSNAALRNAYEACGDPLPIRTLIREDVTFDPDLPDQTVYVDPRPAPGSSLLSAVGTPPLDGFFTPTSYKGAFDEYNCAAGWSKLSQLDYIVSPNSDVDGDGTQDGDVVVGADITTDTTWSHDNEYILDGVIYVTNNSTLTIEPGTVIRGLPDTETPGTNNPGALVITRGSKIYANGTAEYPILMTSKDDSMAGVDLGKPPYTNKFDALEFTAQYGGLILLGRGMVARNTADGPDPANENQIEGLTAEEEKGFYGGCSEVYDPIADPAVCDDDDSGSVNYFTVSYGGFNLAEANEINGITLGGVGRSTDMNHLEVFQNKDDGFEMFGGAVNLKNVIVSNVGDDSFDYDEGWRGKVQFAFSMQGLSGVGVADDQGDHGGEHDGGTGQDDSEPFAIPTFFNTTYIGTGQKDHAKKDGNGVLLIRDNAGSRYYNSAFLDFGGASIMIEGGASETGRSSERAQTDYDNLDPDGDGTDNPGLYLLPTDVNGDGTVDKQLELIDNTFWCIGRQEDPDIVAMGRVGTIPSDGACRLDADPTTGSDTSCAEDADCTTAGESCYDPTERWDNKATKDHFDNGLFSNAALRNTYLSCAADAPAPIATLVREDVTFDPDLPDQTVLVDPRPASGSDLLTSGSTPKDAFYLKRTHKGAFAVGELWTSGWSKLDRLGYVARCSSEAPNAVPSEVQNLEFPLLSDKTLIEWDENDDLINVATYDVLRSGDASDFTGATFVEDNGTNTYANDEDDPANNNAYFYLVRAANQICSGEGNGSLGTASDGTERVSP